MRARWEGEMRMILRDEDEVKDRWIVDKNRYGVQAEKMPLMRTFLDNHEGTNLGPLCQLLTEL